MRVAAGAVFAASLALCFYVYFGYPILIWLLARLRPRPVRRGRIRPRLSVIVPAYNEEASIYRKVRDLLAHGYPPDRLEIVVASDGSTDRTVAKARLAVGHWEWDAGRSAGDRVRILDLPRRGKAATLDAAVERCGGDILVFTDANTWFEEGALIELAESFADPEVGGVCGNQRYTAAGRAGGTAAGESLYWSYDKWIKIQESRAGSIFASDGSLHALRAELWHPLGRGAGADDIRISALAPLQGRRLVFEERAVVWEHPPLEAGAELRRKIRVTVHSLAALRSLGPALWTRGLWSLELLSHKLLRYLVPYFLALMLAANALLAPGSALAAGLLAAQVGFYLLASLGALGSRRLGIAPRILAVPYYFCLANLAALLGLVSLLRFGPPERWEPRGGETEAVGSRGATP